MRNFRKKFLMVNTIMTLVFHFCPVTFGADTNMDQLKIRKIILTTQGGNGHLQAAKRVQKDLEAQGQASLTVDVIKEGYLKYTFNWGQWGVMHWNLFQRQGKVRNIKMLARMQKAAELLSKGQFYHKLSKLLEEYSEVDEVIDTQPLNSDYVLQALMLVNTKYKDTRKVFYRKILTDLPTDSATQFWLSLKRITQEQAEIMTLVTPMVAGDMDGEATKNYYQSLFPNLAFDADKPRLQITYGPIRHSFLERIDLPADKQDPLHVAVTDGHEYKLIAKTAGLSQKKDFLWQDDHAILRLPADAEVHSMMLGSQTDARSMMRYIKHEMDLYAKAKRKDMKVAPLYVFVFVGGNADTSPLYLKLAKMIIDKRKENPSLQGLHILPLSYQGDQMISQLYSMADVVLVRSGGLSCMEIEAVARGVVFIHSNEVKAKRHSDEISLLKGMPMWEAGNAVHVKNTLKFSDDSNRVVFVNEYTFPKAYKLFQERKGNGQLLMAKTPPKLLRELLSPAK